MANKKQLSGQEIIDQLEGLTLEELLSVSISIKLKVDEKRKLFAELKQLYAESLQKIQETDVQLNGNGK